ncbi:MAG TPA: hypothetical protein VIL05_04945 [Thermoclostridium sp.]|jgi:hypothetical protein
MKTGSTVLYAVSVVLTLITGLLTWRNTYYLCYISSYRDDSGWKWVLIPLFGLLLGAISTHYSIRKQVPCSTGGKNQKKQYCN